jgi:phosphatidylserine/phosphatidylglycerophosphate/cardiolipin synthase-like enzyme
MKWLRRSTISVLLLAIFYTASLLFHATTPQPSAPSAQVLSAATNVALFTEPKNGRQPILDALTSAAQTIDVEVYLLSDQQIITALQQAQARGVTVRVMMEQHPFGGGSTNPKTMQTLQQANIAVKWTSSAFLLTHEKSIIVDNKTLFVLNQNLTASSFSKNREYDIIDTNPQDVAEAEQLFNADWNREGFTPTDSHLLVSPVNSRAGLTALVQKATKTIDIEIEDINDPAIVDLLSQKAKTMQVRLITPTIKQVSSNRDAIVQLFNSGVKVRTLSSPYIHAKLINVDGSHAYAGSINLSTQSMDKNRELGIILSQSELVQSLSTSFEADWQQAKDLVTQ